MSISIRRCAALALVIGLPGISTAQPTTARGAMDDLFAADRGFAAAAASTDVVSALVAMFADGVTMPVPSGQFATSKAAAVDALRGNPDNLRSRIEWSPAHGGVSADGQHGFTAGFMTLHRPDGTSAPLKYLAYWVKQPSGWRVVAYKRNRAGEGPRTPPSVAPLVPRDRAAAPADDARESLARAEQSFSDEAQQIGIRAAFAKFGSADSINLGRPNDSGMVVGAESIARMVAEGSPAGGSAVSWGPDRVIVATSGDLGVTIGFIRPHTPAAGQPAAFPFFTIWRRVDARSPWRYVAE